LRANEEEHLTTVATLKEEIKQKEAKIGQLNNDVQSRTNEMNREIRRKERAEREVKQV